MIIIAIFTDKTTDQIQIPLIYLDGPFGIRLCPLLIFFPKLFIEYLFWVPICSILLFLW